MSGRPRKVWPLVCVCALAALVVCGMAYAHAVVDADRARNLGTEEPPHASSVHAALYAARATPPPVVYDDCAAPRIYAQEPSLPWRLYDAFVSTGDGCAVATFVAQYERGCEEMAGVLEAAAGGNATAWLETARAPPGGCRVCATHAFDATQRPKFDEARERAFEGAGGATPDLRCAFEDGSIVAATGHGDFHRYRSTLVFECAVPKSLRDGACEAPEKRTALRVAVDAGGGRAHAAVPVCAFASPKTRVDVAAVAWTAGTPYVDRSRLVKAPPDLRPWLAAHWAFGVRFFLVFESGAAWERPEQSPLWPALAPLVDAGSARLLPRHSGAERGLVPPSRRTLAGTVELS